MIEIFQATKDDVRGIEELLYKTWLVTYPNEALGITVDDIHDRFKDRFSEEELEKKAEFILNEKKEEKRLVAKDGNTIVGLCYLVQREEYNQLQSIYVLPEYQGKGIGKLLWEKMQSYIHPHKDTIVQVVTYNTNAIEFYKKLGFIDTGKRWNNEKFVMKSGAMLPELEMVLKKRG